MHLQCVYRLLLAATQKPFALPKVVDPIAELDVREMVDLGLVEAIISDGRETNLTAIQRVTGAGKQFLKVFEDEDCAVLRTYRKRKEEAARQVEAAASAMHESGLLDEEASAPDQMAMLPR